MKVYRTLEMGALEIQEYLKSQGLLDIEFYFDPMPWQELLLQGYDVIELSDADMTEYLKSQTLLEWEVDISRSADCLIKTAKGYKPIQIGPNTLRAYFEDKKIKLKVQESAVLIGNYSMLMSFTFGLVKLGYKKIIIISPENFSYHEEIEKIKKILFQVELQQISFDEISHVTENSSLLVIDFDLALNPDLVEVLSYFNFLSEKSLFLDLQQINNSSLAEEADRASLTVLSDLEFHLEKYKILKNKLNISP